MDLYENNLLALRTFWATRKNRQNLQMVVYKAIAGTTDLPAKEVEAVLAEIDRLLEVEEAAAPKPDPAL